MENFENPCCITNKPRHFFPLIPDVLSETFSINTPISSTNYSASAGERKPICCPWCWEKRPGLVSDEPGFKPLIRSLLDRQPWYLFFNPLRLSVLIHRTEIIGSHSENYTQYLVHSKHLTQEHFLSYPRALHQGHWLLFTAHQIFSLRVDCKFLENQATEVSLCQD